MSIDPNVSTQKQFTQTYIYTLSWFVFFNSCVCGEAYVVLHVAPPFWSTHLHLLSHICANELGQHWPHRRQGITWNDADLLLKMTSAKLQPFDPVGGGVGCGGKVGVGGLKHIEDERYLYASATCSSLVHVMICRMICVEVLSETVLTDNQLNT